MLRVTGDELKSLTHLTEGAEIGVSTGFEYRSIRKDRGSMPPPSLIRSSLMAERPTVNRVGRGSTPRDGATGMLSQER